VLVLTLAIGACGVERELGSHGSSDGAVAKRGSCSGCAANQVCHRGACIPRSQGGEDCTDPNATRLGAEDGCAPDAVCTPREADAGARCLPYPPCAADDTCPVGAIGSTCNVDFAATKARICLAGQCTSATDCPPSQRCLKTIGDLGFCSAGDPGSPCVVQADCKAARCFGPGGGFGICF
jgi:hypothetical protein